MTPTGEKNTLNDSTMLFFAPTFAKAILLTGLTALMTIILNSCAMANIVEINLNRIAFIESNNNPLAYNRNSGATGMYQITPIVVKEYNNTFRSDLRIKDMFNSEIALTVSNWYINSKIPEYFRVYKIKDTIENRLWAYNAGIGLLKKGIKPLETRKYIAKYNKLNKGVK